MSIAFAEFSPGALVRARGREWVVQPGSSPEALSLRPLGGSEEDIALILPDLELTPPEPATFPLPDPSRHGSHQAATLLRDGGFTFDCVYSSVLTRAVRTANIVLEGMGLLWIPFHKTWRLNERMCVRLSLLRIPFPRA